MDLQEQQILTVFYSGYPAPERANWKIMWLQDLQI